MRHLISGLYRQQSKQQHPASSNEATFESKTHSLGDSRDTHLANTKQLTFGGQNAEAYFAYDNTKLVFQATARHAEKQCDQIYSVNINGSDKKLLSTGDNTTTCSFFYPDDQHILYASTHADVKDCPSPADFSKGYPWRLDNDSEGLAEHQRRLDKGLIRPTSLHLYLIGVDGSTKQHITGYGKASFGPFFHPSGEKIIFASNLDAPKGREFGLYLVDINTKELERVTYTGDFDGFPMFSHNGKNCSGDLTAITKNHTRPMSLLPPGLNNWIIK